MDALKKIIKALNASYTQAISIRDLAGKASWSYSHTCRQFKEQTGDTILQYIHKKRMDLAKKLLKTTFLSSREIAFLCGYNSTKHFHRLFKRHVKTTPGNYRGKKIKKGPPKRQGIHKK